MKKMFLGAFAGLLAISVMSCSGGKTIEEKYREVKGNMDKNKVLAIMGKPESDKVIQQRSGKRAPYSPDASNAGDSAAKFGDYKPEIVQLIWKEGDKTLMIYFEDDVMTTRQASWAKRYINVR